MGGEVIMKISIIQTKIKLDNVVENREKIIDMIINCSKNNPDVIVLPETWNTGFFPGNVKEVADINGEPTISILSGLSKKFKVNIVGGSIANHRKDGLYNTNLVFDREGNMISTYDKVHLFSYSTEDRYFEKGNSTNVYNLENVMASTVICYDIRFPELIRSIVLKGAKVLFVPSQWPKVRIEHWITLLRARAIENQIFVIASNSIGMSNDIELGGNSMIIDPLGNVIVNGGDSEGILTSEIDVKKVDEVRSKIDVFKDRRPTMYENI